MTLVPGSICPYCRQHRLVQHCTSPTCRWLDCPGCKWRGDDHGHVQPPRLPPPPPKS